jgi:hypothetical protein
MKNTKKSPGKVKTAVLPQNGQSVHLLDVLNEFEISPSFFASLNILRKHKGIVKLADVVVETTDENLLLLSENNRGIKKGFSPKRVADIEKKIDKGVWVPTYSILTTNESLELMDGNNRKPALVKKGIPQYFTINHDKRFNGTSYENKKTQVDVNNHSSKWTQDNIYDAALAEKTPVALEIEKIKLQYPEEKILSLHMLSIAKSDVCYLSGVVNAMKYRDYNFDTYYDKSLVATFRSKEFQKELTFYMRLLTALAPIEERALYPCINLIYSLIWNRGLEKETLINIINSRSSIKYLIANKQKRKRELFLIDAYNKVVPEDKQIKVRRRRTGKTRKSTKGSK